MYSKDIRNKVVADYFSSNLTVDQLVEKYNVCKRVIYNWTASERKNRRYRNTAITVRMSKKELEVVNCALFDYKDSSFFPDAAAIANSLRNRIIDKLTVLEEIENANK